MKRFKDLKDGDYPALRSGHALCIIDGQKVYRATTEDACEGVHCHYTVSIKDGEIFSLFPQSLDDAETTSANVGPFIKADVGEDATNPKALKIVKARVKKLTKLGIKSFDEATFIFRDKANVLDIVSPYKTLEWSYVKPYFKKLYEECNRILNQKRFVKSERFFDDSVVSSTIQCWGFPGKVEPGQTLSDSRHIELDFISNPENRDAPMLVRMYDTPRNSMKTNIISTFGSNSDEIELYNKAVNGQLQKRTFDKYRVTMQNNIRYLKTVQELVM